MDEITDAMTSAPLVQDSQEMIGEGIPPSKYTDSYALESNLPDGWVEEINDSGTIYFYNIDTEETSLVRPGTRILSLGGGALEEKASHSTYLPIEVADTVVAEDDLLKESQLNEKGFANEQNESVVPSMVCLELLPEGWSEHTDPSTGSTYFYHAVSGETSWERPKLVGSEEGDRNDIAESQTELEVYPRVDDGATELSSIMPATEDVICEDMPLQDGWTELVEPTTGQTYFYHAESLQTTWERPSASGAVEGRPEADDTTGASETVERPPEVVHETVDDERSNPEVTTECEMERNGDWNLVRSDDSHRSRNPESSLPSNENSDGEIIVASDALIVGWVEIVDPSSGNLYYLNEETNETSWERPSAIQPVTPPVSTPILAPEEPETEVNTAADLRPDANTSIDEDEGNIEQSLTGPLEPEGPLSRGWIKLIDESSCNEYYFNEGTGETTWEKPSFAKDEDEPALVEDQVPASQIAEPETVGTVLPGSDFAEEPQLSTVSPPVATMADQSEDLGNLTELTRDLPNGWVELVDPGSGNPYYFNETENITSWEKPMLSPPNDVCPLHVDKEPATNAPVIETAGERATEAPKVSRLTARNNGRSFAAFATFGFGGRLCVFRASTRSVVKIHNLAKLVPEDPLVVSISKRVDFGVLGPLGEIDSSIVSSYLQTRARGDGDNDLLWSLINIASQSNGRLRSEDGASDPHSPETALLNVLLAGLSTNDEMNETRTPLECSGSLSAVESLLLKGKREEAVEVAIQGKQFAMALLIGSMCDRATFQHVTRKYAEDMLSNGSSLHTLSMLFSGQLQPPSDSELDRAGGSGALWSHAGDALLQSWKQNLAAVISNRILGWDRIVLSLGDRLMELGDVRAAHFCYLVCGCPVTSLLHPSSRMSLVGCDHLVPMDAAMMTPEGIAGFELSEAYEWAKQQGNQSAAIQSLQPLKLIYALRLADSGFSGVAYRYVISIRKCTQILRHSSNAAFAVRGGPFSSWACSERDVFVEALNELEDRLLFQTNPRFIQGTLGEEKRPRKPVVAAPPVSAPLMQTIQSQDPAAVAQKEKKKSKPKSEKPKSSSRKASSEKRSSRNAAPGEDKKLQPSTMMGYSHNPESIHPTIASEQPPRASVGPPLMSPVRDEMSFLSAKSSLTNSSPSTAAVMSDGTALTPVQPAYSSVPTDVPPTGNITQVPTIHGKMPSPLAVDVTASGKIFNDASIPPPAGTTKQVPPFPGALPPPQSSQLPQAQQAPFPVSSSPPKQPATMTPPQKPASYLALTPPMANLHVLEKNSSIPQTEKLPTFPESAKPALQPGVTMPPLTQAPPSTAVTNERSTMEAASASKGRNQLTPPPKSAPAQMTGIKEEKKPTTPSSAGKSSNWGFGLKSRMTKWLNPDATTADIGESMQAYYDEKLKVWVFPGEDPQEKAKPIGPPPTAVSTPKADDAGPPAQSSSSLDPLAAMMAPPPKRAPSSSLRRSAARPSPMIPSMMMMPPGAAGAPIGGDPSTPMRGPPPQFMIFKPSPLASEPNEEIKD